MTSGPTNTVFPIVNACLNASAALCLLIGYIFVKMQRITAHRRAMLCAFGTSVVFLGTYLWYHTHYVSHRFAGSGWIRPVYFFILISHIILAVLIVPAILRLLWLAYKRSFQRHARLARWVWPMWMYTSVTGVLVYFMLYQWFAPGLPA